MKTLLVIAWVAFAALALLFVGAKWYRAVWPGDGSQSVRAESPPATTRAVTLDAPPAPPAFARAETPPPATAPAVPTAVATAAPPPPPIPPPPVDAGGVDPTRFDPSAALPELVARVDDEIFAIRRGALLARVDRGRLATDDGPPFGLLVRYVPEGDPLAESLDLAVGDVLSGIDGRWFDDVEEFDAVRHAGRMMRWWDASAGAWQRKLIDAGWTGLRAPFVVFGERLAKLSQARGAWDDDVLLAAVAAWGEPDLCETALRRARAAGYDDPLLPSLMALAAAGQGRHGDALAWANAALPRIDGPLQYLVATTAYHSALSDYRLEHAAALRKEYDLPYHGSHVGLDWSVSRLTADHRRPRRPPSERVAGATWTDLAPRLDGRVAVAPEHLARGDYARAARRLAEGLPLPFAVEPDGNQSFRLGPGVREGRLTIAFAADVTERGETARAKTFHVSLTELSPDHDFLPLLYCTLHSTGRVDCGGSDPPPARTQVGGLLEQMEEAVLEFTFVGGDVELRLNDKRLYYGPLRELPEGHSAVFSWHVSGMTGRLNKVRWEALGTLNGGG